LNRRTILSIANHTLACILLVLASSFWLDRPVWRANKALLLVVAMFAGAYLAAAVVLAWTRPPDGHDRILRVLGVGLVFLASAFIGLELAQWRWPSAYQDLLTGPLAFYFLIAGLATFALVTFSGERLPSRFGFLVPVVLAAGAALVGAQYFGGATRVPFREVNHLESSLHVVQVTAYRHFIGDRARGGAIAAFGDGYLVAAGNGTIYEVSEDREGATLDVRELAWRVPINREEFGAAGRKAFGSTWTDHYHRERLRVADLIVQPRSDGSLRVFASHHWWNDGKACYTARVSSLEGTREALLAAEGSLAWRTVYESEPCITFNTDGHRGAWFAGYQIGGAMALLGEDSLLFALGDHEFDGWNRNPILPQDPASPYGKILRIDIESGRSEIWSSGHRNPQGMYVDSAGSVWSTEHGPRGGDELNLVNQGANHGWPLESYGTEYWLNYWPVGKRPGRHDEFEQPIVSFVPSIALSALIGISDGQFEHWVGDLLLVSLSGDLRRIRIAEGRAVVVEPLHIDRRLRDVVQGRDGRVVLWTDTQDVIFLEPADQNSPQALKMQCAGCHTFNRRETASIGPNLWEIVGRRVGADNQFRYSDPMKDFGGRWTRERLDRFLADPKGTVPGTTMQFDGIADAEQRERLIDFLEELR
jgi:cytochrome c2